MRKILTGVVALTMALGLVGCARNGTAGTTPAPTMKPTNSPLTTSMLPETTSGAAASPDASMSPGAATSPDASTSPGAATSPGVSANPSGGESTIAGFTEGKEVDVKDAPKVKEAIEKQYPGAEIVSIKHATKDNQQVYAVTCKIAGAEKTVYASPDGTLIPDAATTTPKSGS